VRNARAGFFLLVVAAVLACLPASAQRGELMVIARTFKTNQEQLQSYSWTERLEVRVADTVTELARLHVRYDPDGNLQKTLIEEPEAPPPRRKRARQKRKKTSEFRQNLRELILTYTQFSPKQVHSMFDGAGIFPGVGESAGMLRVQAHSVVREGDWMYLWADEVTKRLRKIEIRTSLEGQPINVVTEFRDLPDGPTYPARTVVKTESKGKPMVLTSENLDFVRQGE
jgi:hypothetical protein